MKTETDIKEALRRHKILQEVLLGRGDIYYREIDRVKQLHELQIVETVIEVLGWCLKDDEEVLQLL
jgi:hypothetical protein